MNKGPFKNDVTAKMGFLTPLPPLSPFVTGSVYPPPPLVTGQIVTNFFRKLGEKKCCQELNTYKQNNNTTIQTKKQKSMFIVTHIQWRKCSP